MNGKYDDIIGMPHYVSVTRPHMSLENRAAQFAPFAALSGHDEAINETARLTDSMLDLSLAEQDNLSKKLAYILSLPNPVSVNITYFMPDSKKEGGCYVTISSQIKTLDEVFHILILADKTEIPLNLILDINGPVFNDMEKYIAKASEDDL